MTYSQGTTAIIVAAGKSVRAGEDKLSLLLGDKSVLCRTLSCFMTDKGVDAVVLVADAPPEDIVDCEGLTIVAGGKTRAESVQNGLKAVKTEKVLVHDGARPFVSSELIAKVVTALSDFRAAVPYVALTDSVRTISQDRLTGFPSRDGLVAVQTPQGFYTSDLIEAYSKFEGNPTDDSEVYAAAFGPVHAVPGDNANVKITSKEDVLGLKSLLGTGYDLHRLGAHKPLILCGIKVSDDGGSVAWSDGDAALHALTDAILSAMGLGDIGSRFPDTDSAYKDADSAVLLSKVLQDVTAAGRVVTGCSLVICLDRPKLMPYVGQMREKLAAICGLNGKRVGITVKTTENTAPDTVSVWAVATVV